MKAFSKDWWYHKVLEACFYRYNPLHIGDNDARMERIRDFAIKRYAEAYHQEKIKEEHDRILGIIEEMVQRREPHPKFGHPKFYIDALSGLYEKIKGG